MTPGPKFAGSARFGKLSPTELALIGVGALIALISGWMIVTDFPLRRYLFGDIFTPSQEVVGNLMLIQGAVRRKEVASTEFASVSGSGVVYNFDTIVTGPESGASIKLNNDAVVELGPRTMVVLIVTPGFAGFGSGATIDLLQGGVEAVARSKNVRIRNNATIISGGTDQKISLKTDQKQPALMAMAAPSPELSPSPSPTPSPTRQVVVKAPPNLRWKWTGPSRGQTLELEPKNGDLSRTIQIKWGTNIVPPPFKFTVEQAGTEILNRAFAQPTQSGSIALKLHKPGKVLLKAVSEKGAVLADLDFVLSAEFEGIELEEPLVAGRKASNSEYMGSLQKDFTVEFLWKPAPGVTNYKIQFFKNPKDSTPALVKETAVTKYLLKKSQAFKGEIYYQVIGQTGLFVRRSKRVPFRFDFMPPVNVLPPNESTVAKGAGDAEILFTWQKTNFTEEYQIEIALVPDFSKILLKKQLKDNFLVVRNLKHGSYYWRVRSITRSVSSLPSNTSKLTLVPAR